MMDNVSVASFEQPSFPRLTCPTLNANATIQTGPFHPQTLVPILHPIHGQGICF